MKHKTQAFKYTAIVLTMLLFITGCTSSFVDLSEDESKQIVNYSTNVLNDHNATVKGSLKSLTDTDLKDIVIKDDPSIIEEIEAAKEEATREFEEAAGHIEPESSSSGSGESAAEEGNVPLEIQNADIASIIGLQGFSVDYSGHSVLDSYPDPSDPEADMLFSIEPATAKDKLLVLYFNVTNTGEEEAECDILDLRPKFRFKTDGKTHSFLTTLLLDDLSTLEVTLQPGESKRAVLVAELSEEKTSALSGITLIVVGEGDNTEIILEKPVDEAGSDEPEDAAEIEAEPEGSESD